MYRILCESPTYPLYWLLVVLLLVQVLTHSGSISVYTPIKYINQ